MYFDTHAHYCDKRFDEVVVRVSPDFATYMHVDYDEYNAAALSGSNNMGEIVD